MRASQYLIATQKEIPADAEVISHQLMLRAGLIRRLAAGLYTWLPLGLRTLRKVEAIVREEMDRAGALEVLMPAVQPAELWEESGRWTFYGDELLRLKDRHQRDFCVGPTHEEVITDLVRNEIRSYKSLPVNFYQVQTKFRDERRPRFGIMRAREFIMKDAYSFHLDSDSLDTTYAVMHAAYTRIFERIGLDFRAVAADGGSIGGSASHEFHVLAESGEDLIAFSDESAFAANIELAEAPALVPDAALLERMQQLPTEPERIATPGVHTISELCSALDVPAEVTVKTLFVRAEADSPSPLVALVLRGDHELNAIKAEKLHGVAKPLTFADDAMIRTEVGAGAGSLGPLGLNCPVWLDRSVAVMTALVCGANEDGWHLSGVQVTRELAHLLPDRVADLRNVVMGDPSPDGQGRICLRRGIEVGHIFKLGTKYSEALKATVLDPDGRAVVMPMGCYGIGVTRVVAAAIEQNHDASGIIWPLEIAPFEVVVVPLNGHKSEPVRDTAEQLYRDLQAAGFDVLLDDRQERPGVKFADMELMGIPHRIVISDRGLQEAQVEYKGRRDASASFWPLSDAVSQLRQTCQRQP